MSRFHYYFHWMTHLTKSFDSHLFRSFGTSTFAVEYFQQSNFREPINKTWLIINWFNGNLIKRHDSRPKRDHMYLLRMSAPINIDNDICLISGNNRADNSISSLCAASHERAIFESVYRWCDHKRSKHKRMRCHVINQVTRSIECQRKSV